MRCTVRTGSLRFTDSSDLSPDTAASNSTTAGTILLKPEWMSIPVFWGIARKLANPLPNGLHYRLFDSLHCEISNKLLELLPNTQHNGSFPPDTTLISRP